MANFIEYASKAQEELNAQLQAISDRELKNAEKASLLANREAELDKRTTEIAEADKALEQKREELSMWEGRKLREEEAIRLHDEGLRMQKEASDKLKKAENALIESKQNLEELSKRELALSDREKSYKDEVMKEMMQKMLGR